MSKQMIYSTIGAWLAIVAAVVGFGLVSRMPVTIGTGTLAFMVAFIPPAILLKLFGDPEPQTVAQLLKERP